MTALENELLQLNLSFLKKTTIRVRNAAGKVTTEERTENGYAAPSSSSSSSASSSDHVIETQGGGEFFVIDDRPDAKLHKVIQNLYIGSQDAAANLEGLKESGISLIVNCGFTDNFFKHDPQFADSYLNLNVSDLPSERLITHFDNTNKIIHKTRTRNNNDDNTTTTTNNNNSSSSSSNNNNNNNTDNADNTAKNTGVLVHCNAGVSRSATIVCAYLIQMQNMTADEALACVRSARSSARPNDGFMEQLREYEKMNKGNNKKQ